MNHMWEKSHKAIKKHLIIWNTMFWDGRRWKLLAWEGCTCLHTHLPYLRVAPLRRGAHVRSHWKRSSWYLHNEKGCEGQWNEWT